VFGLAALIVAVWFFAVWRPATSDLHRSVEARTVAITHRQQTDAQLDQLLALERAVPKTETELGQTVRELPAGPGVDTVIDQINAIAQRDAITWTNESQTLAAAGAATPSTSGTATSSSTTAAGGSTAAPAAAAPPASGSSTLSLTLDVSGSYVHMAHFIGDLEHLPRLVVIDDLAYSPQTGNGVGVSIGARAFYDPEPVPASPSSLGGS
jgi:Tfp pilus assembly protein PilO